jgi:tetratricopeptide (TPR) repeat protein
VTDLPWNGVHGQREGDAPAEPLRDAPSAYASSTELQSSNALGREGDAPAELFTGVPSALGAGLRPRRNGRPQVSRSLLCYALMALLSLLCLTHPAAAASQENQLQEAMREYRSALDCPDREDRLQRFHRAELLFSRLVEGDRAGRESKDSGIRNADLYCHLGNAALGAERLGSAILAYRRALRLDPDHRQSLQNLRHARTLLPEWVPRPEEGGFLDTFLGWSTRLSHNDRHLAAGILCLATTVLLAVSIRWQRPAFRQLALIPAVAWLFFVATSILAFRQSAADAAVVTVPEVIARAADSINAPSRFSQPLPAGTEVDVVERRDEWLQVQLADARDAWIPRDTVEFVSSD